MKVDVDKLLKDKNFKRDLKRAVENMLVEFRRDKSPARLGLLGVRLFEQVNPEILCIADDTSALGELIFEAVAEAVVAQLVPKKDRSQFYHDLEHLEED